MSPDDETKELDAPWPFGPWAHKIAQISNSLFKPYRRNLLTKFCVSVLLQPSLFKVMSKM